jgi:hypothetical protein
VKDERWPWNLGANISVRYDARRFNVTPNWPGNTNGTMENIVRSCDGKFAAPGYLVTEQLGYRQSKVDENVRISNDILAG